MRKRSLWIIGLTLITATSAFAKINQLNFAPKPFDDNSYTILVYDTTNQLKVQPLNSQSYDFAFRDKQSRFEIRYTMFSQTGPTEDFKSQVAMWAVMVLQNIAGNEKTIRSATPFKNADVKAEFQADYGLTAFIVDGSSDFTQGWKYAMVNFFYKKKIGIMCQAILFKDASFARDPLLNKMFHSFHFNEQKE